MFAAKPSQYVTLSPLGVALSKFQGNMALATKTVQHSDAHCDDWVNIAITEMRVIFLLTRRI